ncbi:hypothetical protein FNV62_05880 [Streptomyces sp. RLB3-17]|uniref:hypothetical protein n=1 Tax=Streptomyces sp. RLB3-17 TaxID=2594455 RepID=UPI001165BEE4|nr:hypothetical protein [Streptomyces sp. RLB3-17]QDO37782.1 hypothetical protein FNV62_05880 [Streptomyces sp. RLB3-17]
MASQYSTGGGMSPPLATPRQSSSGSSPAKVPWIRNQMQYIERLRTALGAAAPAAFHERLLTDLRRLLKARAGSAGPVRRHARRRPGTSTGAVAALHPS